MSKETHPISTGTTIDTGRETETDSCSTSSPPTPLAKTGDYDAPPPDDESRQPPQGDYETIPPKGDYDYGARRDETNGPPDIFGLSGGGGKVPG